MSSTLQLQSTHMALRSHTVTQRAEIIPPRTPPKELASPAANTSIPGPCSCYEGSEDGLSPALSFIRGLLERIFGVRIDVFTAPDVGAAKSDIPDPAGATAASGGAIFEHHETHTEAEQLTFEAQGTVTTGDGRTLTFDVSFATQREHSERFDATVRIGAAAQLKDPLVLNFSGTQVELAADRVRFDLDADGRVDEFVQLAQENFFLAWDRNGNGAIDDGRELFGPIGGSGFSELAALDNDGNGWLDEQDAAWRDLKLWRPGEAPIALSAADVGALSVSSARTPFELKDTQRNLLGLLRQSGVYLLEGGSAGLLQQLDIAA